MIVSARSIEWRDRAKSRVVVERHGVWVRQAYRSMRRHGMSTYEARWCVNALLTAGMATRVERLVVAA